MDKDKRSESERLYTEIQWLLQSLQAKEKYYIKRMKLRHKIIFAFVVFFGINLVWYGMWGIVGDIPFLNKPIVSLIIGAIILIVTGFFYENLISASFNKKKMAKHKGS